jgi:hypothetical protein
VTAREALAAGAPPKPAPDNRTADFLNKSRQHRLIEKLGKNRYTKLGSGGMAGVAGVPTATGERTPGTPNSLQLNWNTLGVLYVVGLEEDIIFPESHSGTPAVLADCAPGARRYTAVVRSRTCSRPAEGGIQRLDIL